VCAGRTARTRRTAEEILTVTEFATLDGVGQAPGGPSEDRDGGFEHGGWQARFVDHAMGAAIFDWATRMEAPLLDRRTYEIFADYWPDASLDIPFTAVLDKVLGHLGPEAGGPRAEP
jgi:acyl-coenzyme A thioesterase PaaI-like protein